MDTQRNTSNKNTKCMYICIYKKEDVVYLSIRKIVWQTGWLAGCMNVCMYVCMTVCMYIPNDRDINNYRSPYGLQQ